MLLSPRGLGRLGLLLVVLIVVLGAGVARAGVPAPGASCLQHQPFFDSVFSANQADFDQRAASGDGFTYYVFSYVLESTLAMYEATGDLPSSDPFTVSSNTDTWASGIIVVLPAVSGGKVNGGLIQ